MITFDIDIQLGGASEATYPAAFNIVLDVLYRNDTSLVAIAYMRKSDAVMAVHETSYTAAAVNAETTTETTYTGKINQALHKLEKARLEALNPSATFTITL